VHLLSQGPEEWRYQLYLKKELCTCSEPVICEVRFRCSMLHPRYIFALYVTNKLQRLEVTATLNWINIKYRWQQCLSRSIIIWIDLSVPNVFSVSREVYKWNQSCCSRTFLVLLFRAINTFTELLINGKQTCLLRIVSRRSKNNEHV